MRIRQLIILTLVSITSMMHAEEPAEPVEFRYYIPLLESTFDANWEFRLIMGSIEDLDTAVTLTGISSKGSVIFETPHLLGPGQSLFWSLGGLGAREKLARVQSLQVVSTVELTGVLWMRNDDLGFLNVVGIDEMRVGPQLFVQHIPGNLDEWYTTFAVMGVDQGQSAGELNFHFYDDDGTGRDKVLDASLSADARITATPYYDLILPLEDGELASWATLNTGSDSFAVAGFQNIVHYVDEKLSSALELQAGPGHAEGFVGFSDHPELKYVEAFAVTNANEEPVVATFTLHYRPEADPETDSEVEEVPAIEVREQVVTFQPKQRHLLILGSSTFFPELKGQAYSLGYVATAVPVEPVEGEEPVAPEPLPLLALHLQTDGADGIPTRLGAHHFQPGMGGKILSWLDLGGAESVLEVFNPSQQEANLNVVLTDNRGKEVLSLEPSIEPGGVLVLDSNNLKTVLLEQNPEMEPNAILRLLVIQRQGEGLFGKLTSLSRNGDGEILDIGISNPVSFSDEPVEPDFQP